MASALGFVIEVFDPTTPGRLCRGRERWIEYETMETEEESTPIHRIIMSGATFSDDRARDARRGIAFGPVGYAPLLQSLLGDGMLVAYCEEGHPQEVPETAAGVEHHTVARPGGEVLAGEEVDAVVVEEAAAPEAAGASRGAVALRAALIAARSGSSQPMAQRKSQRRPLALGPQPQARQPQPLVGGSGRAAASAQQQRWMVWRVRTP